MVNWLKLGDQNTKFFHRSLLNRYSKNTINSLQDDAGDKHTDEREMGKLAITYYKKLFCSPRARSEEDVGSFYVRSLSEEDQLASAMTISDEEIKDVLFSIPDDKTPGLDGFTCLFFKATWHVTGPDVIVVVRYFFQSKEMPRCLNSTQIVLIPKKENPHHLDDYRPISCYNVIYKCISKVLAARLKAFLP